MAKTYVSDCCGAPVTVAGRTTQYYVCQQCDQPCDAARVVTMRPVDESEDVW